MKRPKPRFDPVALIRATNMSQMYVEESLKRARNIQDDTKAEERLAAYECKACFYVLGKIGGAAMTTQPCACCGKDQLYGSTCTDFLCMECAKEHKLCKHCGGDIELKIRRKKWPEPPETGTQV